METVTPLPDPKDEGRRLSAHWPTGKTKGEVAFDLYCRHKKGLTFDGRKIPPFHECGPDVQAGWEYAAEIMYRCGYEDGYEDGEDEFGPPAESAKMADRTLG